MTQILDKIEKTAAARKCKARARLESLIRTIGDGEPGDPEAIARALEEAGKTPEEFRASVELYVRRKELRAKLDGQAIRDREAEEARATLKVADDALRAAERDHERIAGPLYARLAQLQQENIEANSARNDLLRNCPYPGLLEELAACRRRGDRIRRTLESLGREIHDVEHFITETCRVRSDQSRSERGERLKAAQRARERLEDFQARHEQARQAWDDHERELLDIQERMLNP